MQGKQPQVLPGQKVVGFQLRCRAILGDRLGRETLLLKYQAQVVVRFRIGRPKRERPAETRRRGLELAQAHPDIALVVVIVGFLRPLGNGAANQIHRQCRLAGLQREDTEQMQRIGVIGLVRQDLPVKGLRLAQLARLMILDREVEGLLDRHSGLLVVITTVDIRKIIVIAWRFSL